MFSTILTCAYRVRFWSTPEKTWPPVVGIGGDNGYCFGNPLWRLRGAMDRWVGGVGLRKGMLKAIARQSGPLPVRRIEKWRPHPETSCGVINSTP